MLPLDCATEKGLKSFAGTNKSTSAVLRDKTMFSHSDSQECFEWVPTVGGMAAWVAEEETFSAKIPNMKIAGPASLMSMGQVHCSWLCGALPVSSLSRPVQKLSSPMQN